VLQSLLALFTTKPLDVQIWYCDPLLVVIEGDEIKYGLKTKVEFTPFESETIIGHAIVETPGSDGLRPEIAIFSRQYIDAPSAAPDGTSRRQGLILMGNGKGEEPVTWFINGAADQFLTAPPGPALEYDEATAKILEAELSGEPEKLNLNTRF
jgi:hypothetical protein